jgi:transposase
MAAATSLLWLAACKLSTEGEIAELRAYLRQRERLLDYAASHIQHMQKALTEMNVQLHHVVADITGATGMRIIRTIIPADATQLCWRYCATGAATRPLRIPAATHDPPIERAYFDVRAAQYAVLGKDLTQIHGLGPYLALKLVAECGEDLSAWPSAKHFTSWLCLAPQQQDLGWQDPIFANPTIREPCRGAFTISRRSHRPN